MNYFLLALAICITGFIVLMCWSSLKHRKTKSTRKHLTFNDFSREFRESEIQNIEAIKIAYEDLEKLAGYPVSRDDDLEKTLGFLPEDFESMLETRVKNLGVANIYDSKYSKTFPLKTPADYVHFLDEVLAGGKGSDIKL